MGFQAAFNNIWKVILEIKMAKYSVNQYPVETLLSWIKSGEIAIPEIQRPFVWNNSKVRDLLDSLYKG